MLDLIFGWRYNYFLLCVGKKIVIFNVIIDELPTMTASVNWLLTYYSSSFLNASPELLCFEELRGKSWTCSF